MKDERFIQRCFDLASLGAGSVAPNPLVGAVLVHNGKIIGEGWHQRWGEAHAEVNCIHTVLPENKALLPYATLYCNLEPCSHFGKTPPCADLIIAQKIPRVVVSNVDPNVLVAGRGLEKLKNAGIAVTQGLLEEEGRWLNRTFFTWITEQRPQVVLKWAQSADGFLGKKEAQTAISNAPALRLVHRWRAECDAILVGAHTALIDNPRLDVRHYFGKKPLRIAFDTQEKIPASHHLLDDSTETWIFGSPLMPVKDRPNRAYSYKRTKFIQTVGKILITNILEALKKDNRASLFVEGGANVLGQFLETGFWDEIRVVENSRRLGSGIIAPNIPTSAVLKEQWILGDDTVRIFARSTP